MKEIIRRGCGLGYLFLMRAGRERFRVWSGESCCWRSGPWLLALLAVLFAVVPKAAGLALLVPAYFSPGEKWNSLNDAAERVPLVAILNPNSGPGRTVNSGYVNAVKALKRSKGRVIGYVSSSYTARSMDEVRQDIDRYYSFYDIDGIFVDEMTNDSNAEHLTYYETIYRYVKAKNAAHSVIGNPGINAVAAYVTRPATDTLVTFENKSDYERYVPDVWTKTQPPATLAHLCYSVTNAATMTNYLQLAVERNAGYIYVTDDGGNNPWDQLPSYWTAEVGLVESINRQAAQKRRAELEIEATSGDQLQINVAGAPGRYVLQGSTDLSSWQPEGTNLSATGRLSFDLPRRPEFTGASFRTEQ